MISAYRPKSNLLISLFAKRVKQAISVMEGISIPPGSMKGAGPRFLSVIVAKQVGIYWQNLATTLMIASSSKLPLNDSTAAPKKSAIIQYFNLGLKY